MCSVPIEKPYSSIQEDADSWNVSQVDSIDSCLQTYRQNIQHDANEPNLNIYGSK